MNARRLILIIDDDPVIVMTTRAVLDASGYESAGALGYDEALGFLNAKEPDLVLCDMMMESIDTGVSLVREIKARYPRVQVILISSIADAVDNRYDFSKIGFDGFLKKPIDPELLVGAVREALDRRGGA